ncbi:MAG: N-acetylmuramoyl-L-alanine amidase, partial [Deltaproteobacteria bacterium]|nr:N-acetylmuramoyl-L-alanine amidase [Deltaproteobacteria bacterium]
MRPGAAALLAFVALAVPRDAGATKIFLNASDQTSNPVACGGNEAQYAADVGQRGQARLQAYGFDVRYSQDFYNSPSLANNWGAQSFVSIHTNAGGGHGTETLYKSSAGQTLAGHVNGALVAALGLPNRGLKYRDNLHVLNATSMPAVLTELLFHDCTTTHSTPIGSLSESCFQTKAAGRAIEAEAVAKGVCARWGVACQAGPPPHPTLSLAVAVLDVAGQARDFAGGDGVFDLLVGQETTVRVTVTNAADATAHAAHVAANVALAAPGLSIVEWHVYDNYPGNACGGDWCPNSAETNAANPPRQGPGAAFDLQLDGFSEGEAKRVELKVQAAEPTDGEHPELRFFVKHVDDFYEKTGWGAAPNHVGGYQTFNGGDLRIASKADVWPQEDAGVASDGGVAADAEATADPPPDEPGDPGPGADAGAGFGAHGLTGACAA